MLDHHIDEFDRSGRRGSAREKFTERVADRRAIETDQRADEAAEPLARLPCALDVASFSDAGVQQHLFKLAEVGWCKWFALPQLVKHDVAFMCFKEMPRLLLKASEVGLADLRQYMFDS